MEQTALHTFLGPKMYCMRVRENIPTQGGITQKVLSPIGIRTKDFLAVKEQCKPVDHQALYKQFDGFLLEKKCL